MTAPLSYFTRDKECIKLFDFDAYKAEGGVVERTVPPFPLPTPKAALWSPDGSSLALVDPQNGVQVVAFDGDDPQATSTFSLTGASKTTQSFLWSPKSSFVVSVAPGQKGSTEANIHVWRRGAPGAGYSLEASYSHPKLEKGAKVLQWTPDEGLCARLLPDGRVHVLKGTEMNTEPLVELKLAHGIQSFEFAPVRSRGAVTKGRLAVFVPDARDDMQRVVGPAEVHIFELSATEGGFSKQDKVKTNVAAGQVADLQWNSTGSALIAHCQTEVDETGLSYYGGSKLILISSDGECQKDLMDSQEGLVTNGSIVQACAWSPTRDEFILIHGFQPSQASLFSWDERSKKVALAKVLLEKAHRNTIRFNHFGSLVCLAGFGNLAGQVDFFGRSDDQDEEKCDFVRISSCQANCTVSAEWAPDGRHFITSVLAPRMRVDNGAHVWRALTGTKVCGTDFDELFDVQWRPEPRDSLRFLDVTVEEVESASKELVKAGTSEGAAKQKQAYRPPKARGEGASTVAAMMRGEVAAPEGDDRRKRQPRQMRQREEDMNPSPRPDGFQEPRDRRGSGNVSDFMQELENQLPPQPSPERGPPQHPPPPNPQLTPQQQQLQDRLALQQAQHALQQQQQQQLQQQQLQQAQQQQQQRREVAAAAAAQEQQLAAARQEQLRRQRELALQQQHDREMALQQQQQQRAAAQAQQAQQAARERAAPQQASPARPGDVAGMSLESQAQNAYLRQLMAQGQGALGAGYPQQAAELQRRQQLLQQQHQQQLERQQLQQQQLLQERQRQQQHQQLAAAQARQAQAAQAHQQSQQQAHLRPPPVAGWEYIDPKGNQQGPFNLVDMQQWNNLGYFRPELMMRCDPLDDFIPFSQLYPPGVPAFTVYPKRPPPKNNYRM